MNVSDFIAGGLASMGAMSITNPLEVVKTRIQLQGELAARGTYAEPYSGIFHSFVTIVKNDGWMGLQKGLVSALYFQFIMNSFKLGVYHTAMSNGWLYKKNGDVSFGLGVVWGSIGGVVGAYFSSPFFMVKTQLQSKAAKKIAVGYQHEHTGTLDALRQMYNKGGVYALWRGSTGALPRAAIGSGFQMATFGKTKNMLQKHDLVTHPILNSLCAGFSAGCVVTVAITPPDLIATRLYNQGVDEKGRGLHYNNWIDCFAKIWRSEGIYGLYKGFWANYLRRAPHSTLMLVFFDRLLALRDSIHKK